MKTIKQNRPNQYQIYAYDANGDCTHAGVHGLPRLTIKAIKRMQRKWQAWREQYLRTHPGDYPLHQNRPTAQICVHLLGLPNKCYWFRVS